jgi:hypothetical protein
MMYEVPIVYRGQSNYIVEADSPEEAERIAKNRYHAADPPDELGNEWEEIERIGEVSEVKTPAAEREEDVP